MAEITATTRIALIGGGKMGEAIMGGWIACASGSAAVLTKDNFIVVNPGAERRAFLSERYGVACVADLTQVQAADVVVLAVKPQVMMGVLDTIATMAWAPAALFISIAAGLTTTRLQEALPAGAHLVRVMPNTPLLVGAGASAVCEGSQASADEGALVCDLFACLGQAHLVDEASMDAVGALSGSGPAYVAALVEHLRDAGVAQGLNAALAESLAIQTVYGTAQLLRETQQTPEQVRVSVCSPGGSTLAALAAMDKAGIAAAYGAGVAAAVKRSKELGSC
ncbi:MAG: pyrroline-5-carboxylate reductase [Raoultibacter sp.]